MAVAEALTIYNGLAVLKGRINSALADANQVADDIVDDFEAGESRGERDTLKRVSQWLDDTLRQYPDRSVFGTCVADSGRCRTW